MFTDMVGYTALGQRNESLSLALVEEQRKLIRPILARHNGREVKTIGDAFLVEFPNAVDAVRCAYDIQRAIREFNLSLESGKRIHLRIGVHVGEVVESQGDISGDAVNLASRIEPLAEDGGVCLTRQVYDHVQNKVDLNLSSLGPKALKNVDTAVEVYKVVMPWNEKEAISSTTLDKKRIAVLPLANVSPSPSDEYFAVGLTDELITTVSQLPGLQVIARTSVMPYKETNKAISQVGRELQVGSVIEGSVRKVANRIRVTTQLIETETQAPVWASTYDRELDDIFAIQSDIARRVAEALKIKLLSNEKERLDKVPTRDTEAYILYLKGRNYIGERTHEGFKRALEHFEEAVKRDPGYAHPYAGLSDCYHLMENWGFLKPRVAWPKAVDYATTALKLDDTLAEAHTSMAICLAYVNWDWEGSDKEYRRALEINPNYATAHHWYAMHNLVARGRWEDAIREVQLAAKLDPFSPIINTNVGVILFFAGRSEEAVKQLRHVVEMNPEFAYAHSKLGLALASLPAVDEAVAETRKAIDLTPQANMIMPDLVYAYVAARRKADAEVLLQRLEETSKERYVPSTVFAMYYAVLGRRDDAFAWLERAAEEGTSTLPENVYEPHFDSIRTDSRFQRLLRRIGLE
jgi:TolB-like protein/Flp pilus assembly protein TadD